MADQSIDLVPRLLTWIHEDIIEFRKSVETRIERVETLLKQERQDTTALTAMIRGAGGLAEKRAADLETRVTAIENSGH